jgi:hypothetical protein
MIDRDGGAMMSLRRTRAAFGALLAALAACGGGRGMRYQDPAMDFGAIRTVAVMPFVNLSRDNLAGERVRDVFATELLATGAVYVVPAGEVARGVGKAGIAAPQSPSAEEVVQLGTTLKADGIVTGVVKEYGEVRSGTATSNVVSLSVQLFETATGKVVWAGSTTRGGVSFGDRLLGGGGQPLNDVTEAAVDDILGKMLE